MQVNNIHPTIHFHSPLNVISLLLISGSKSVNGLVAFCMELAFTPLPVVQSVLR